MNELLSSLTNFTISIEQKYSKKSSSIEIYKTESSLKLKKLNLRSSSGYEEYICGLCLRIAIIELANIPIPNFIIIDEGFTCMDETNIENVSILYEYLREKYDFCLIVSHLNSLKAQSDSFINITKLHQNANSQIYFT